MSEQQELLPAVEIARRASKGALTYVMRTGVTQAVQAVSSVAVARVLDPKAYGVFALALTLMGAVRVLGDLGITYSLTVRRDISEADLRAGCTVALAVALLGGGAASVIWPHLALVRAAGHGALWIAPALMINLLVTVPAVPSTIMLERRLEFSKLGVISVVQTVVLFGTQVVLLLAGFGLWSLVLAQIIGIFVGTCLTVRASGRLYLPILGRQIGRLVRAGIPFQAAIVAASVTGTVTTVVVAALLGAKGIGLFAWCTILATPVAGVLAAVHSVSAPTLARMRRDDGSLYDESVSVVTQTLAVTAAIGAGCLIGLTHPTISFVFGSRWLPATSAVQFCLLGTIPLAVLSALASDANARLLRRLTVGAALAGGAATLVSLVPLVLVGGVGGAAAAAYCVGPAVAVGAFARGLHTNLWPSVMKSVRLFAPLAALSFGLGRVATAPLPFAGACVLAAGAAVGGAYVAEGALVRRIWRQLRPAAAAGPVTRPPIVWSPTAPPRETMRIDPAVRRIAAVITAVLALSLVTVLIETQTHIGTTAAFAIPLVALIVALCFFNPRTEISMALFLVYLGAIDGFVKLESGSSTITVGRDVLLWSIALGILARGIVRRQALTVPRYTPLVLLFVAIVALQALNPSSGGLRADIGGFRQHLEFVPLFFIAPGLLNSTRRMQVFFSLLLLVAFANGIVGLVQFNLTTAQLASWGPGFAKLINGTGVFVGAGRTFSDAAGVAHPRPPALGSDEGFGGVLGSLAIPGGLMLLGQLRSLRFRLIVIAGLLGAVTGVLTSQARLSIVTAVAATLAFALLTASTPGRRRQVIGLGVGIAVVYAFVSIFIGANSSSGLLGRYNSISVAAFSQNRGSSLAVVPRYIADYPLGDGVGRSGPAAGFGGTGSSLNAENEFNLLTTEVGVPGLLLMLALWFRTIGDGVRLTFRRRDDYGGCIAAMVAALIGVSIAWLAAATTVSSPTSPYFWLTAGVIGTAFAATQPRSLGVRRR